MDLVRLNERSNPKPQKHKKENKHNHLCSLVPGLLGLLPQKDNVRALEWATIIESTCCQTKRHYQNQHLLMYTEHCEPLWLAQQRNSADAETSLFLKKSRQRVNKKPEMTGTHFISININSSGTGAVELDNFHGNWKLHAKSFALPPQNNQGDKWKEENPLYKKANL